jgi:hypothetical protein
MYYIKDNELLRQFETTTENGSLKIEYSLQDKKMFLTKLIANENEAEEEVHQFITQVLGIAEDRKFRVVPTNSRLVSFFRNNKKFQQLLPPGIKI